MSSRWCGQHPFHQTSCQRWKIFVWQPISFDRSAAQSEGLGRVRDVSEVVDERDLQMVLHRCRRQGRRSQRSIPSTQDAFWEDPRPTVEFDLTQVDSSDEDRPGRNVMPRLGGRDDNSSTIL